MLPHADAVAQNSAARKRAARVNHQHRDALPPRATAGDQRIGQRAFARARRTCDADDHTASKLELPGSLQHRRSPRIARLEP